MEKTSEGTVILWECYSDLVQTYRQRGELHQDMSLTVLVQYSQPLLKKLAPP